MTKRVKTRIGFYFGENFHEILCLHETPKVEVIIVPAFAENYSEIQFGNPNADVPINDQHYSLHNDRPQNKDVNVINHTIEYTNGNKQNTRIYTRALTTNNLLCPLFSVRGQDYSISKYRTTKNNTDTYIDIGEYYPQESTLYWMVVASNSGYTFEQSYPDLNITTIHFSKYAISVIWCFGMIPSHPTGNKHHFLTLEKHKCRLEDGYTETEVIYFKRSQRLHLHISFLEYLQREFPKNASEYEVAKMIGFKRSAKFEINENDEKVIKLNQAYQYSFLAESERETGNITQALEYCQVSKSIFKEQNHLLEYARVLNIEGITLQISGQPSEAIMLYKEAISIYNKLNETANVSITYLNLSNVYRDTSDTETAIKLANTALDIATKNNLFSAKSDSNRTLGILYKKIEKMSEAFYHLKEAMIVDQMVHNKKGEAYCLANMGILRAKENKYQESLHLHMQALSIFTSLNYSWGIANELANVGNMNCLLKNYLAGFKQLYSALELHRKNAYQYGIAIDLCHIGIHLINTGLTIKGITQLEESMKILADIENQTESNEIKDRIINVLRNL